MNKEFGDGLWLTIRSRGPAAAAGRPSLSPRLVRVPSGAGAETSLVWCEAPRRLAVIERGGWRWVRVVSLGCERHRMPRA